MRAKQRKENYSQRTFAPPKTTHPEDTRQKWDQRYADARAFEAMMRAQEREENRGELQ